MNKHLKTERNLTVADAFQSQFTTRVVKKVALGKAMVECLITFSKHEACISKHHSKRQQIPKKNFGFFHDDEVECNVDN